MKISRYPWHSAVAITLTLALTTACTDKAPNQPMLNTTPSSTAVGVPEATQVGVVPAGPGKEAAETTSAVKSDMSKSEQSNAMPMPGQVNDHSTPAIHPEGKASNVPR